MAVPTAPAIADLIVSGMKLGGQYSATAGSTAVTDFTTYFWQAVKSDIWLASKTDPLLLTESVVLATLGTLGVTLPTDFDSEADLWLYDADAQWRATAASGGATSVTLPSDFSCDADAILGRYIFTLSGTGSGQYKTITAYDNTTKVVTVHSAWSTNPDSTTAVVIGLMHYRLQREDRKRSHTYNYRPYFYKRRGTSTMELYPAPDRIYPILLQYYANLTRIDETGTMLVRHMQERRSLWLTGVKYYTQVRYDDERQIATGEEWKLALAKYAATTTHEDDQIEAAR